MNGLIQQRKPLWHRPSSWLQPLAWRLLPGVLLLAGASAAVAGPAVYALTRPDGSVVYSHEHSTSGARVALPGTPRQKRSEGPVLAQEFPSSFGVAQRSPTPAERKRSAHRPRVKPELDRLIAVLARHYGVDPHLVRAVVEVESNFNPNARSPKGATGLMQLMPATAARYHRASLYDPVKNIEAGVLYLRDLLRMFGGDPELALAGYNAGEGAVLKYQRRIPPYAETQAYVPKVMAAWKRNRTDPDLPKLSAAEVRLP